MNNIPRVLELVVNNDLCIGCGMCAYKCPENALKMSWDDLGFIIPVLSRKCDGQGECLLVCPFNPYPKKEVRTENELENLFLKDSTQYHNKIGRYVGIYAGYAHEFRGTSSSGGMATYILIELLRKGIIDHVFSVKESGRPDVYYEYAISCSRNELLAASKTKYFPVTLDTVLSKIGELNGKIAIVGVACFIKAIRLLQYEETSLKKKIPFLVGIICGGIKSRSFTEYLAGKAGVTKENILKPEFRIKDFKSTADDYSFGCVDRSNNKKTIKMRSVGDMWGTGLFKANACDFCDDITTELADISLGDAWLKPYINDGLGTSVIVTRSALADRLIQEGIRKSSLNVEQLSPESFLASQQGSFNHRHTGLPFRKKQALKRNITIPPKRYEEGNVPLYFKIVQIFRMRVRRESLSIWNKHQNAIDFDRSMAKHLINLKRATTIYHLRNSLVSHLRKLASRKRTLQ